jgi:hypothetical protein
MKRSPVLPLLLVLLAACEARTTTGPDGTEFDAPQNVAASYEWILEGWVPTDRPDEPVGDPAVQISWDLPVSWGGEPFRVYARRSGGGSYALVATVTSCATSRCLYTDINVLPGQSYDYYVVAVDERRGREGAASNRVSVSVPAFRAPPAPVAPTVTALDNALLLRWQPGGPAADIWKYRVFLFAINDESVFYQVGETDGTGFLDLRAQNGASYTYRIAAIDFDGHVSRMSARVTGTPRAGGSSSFWSEGDVSLRFGELTGARQSSMLVPVPTGHPASSLLDVVDGSYRLRPAPGS